MKTMAMDTTNAYRMEGSQFNFQALTEKGVEVQPNAKVIVVIEREAADKAQEMEIAKVLQSSLSIEPKHLYQATRIRPIAIEYAWAIRDLQVSSNENTRLCISVVDVSKGEESGGHLMISSIGKELNKTRAVLDAKKRNQKHILDKDADR